MAMGLVTEAAAIVYAAEVIRFDHNCVVGVCHKRLRRWLVFAFPDNFVVGLFVSAGQDGVGVDQSRDRRIDRRVVEIIRQSAELILITKPNIGWRQRDRRARGIGQRQGIIRLVAE